MFSFQNSLIWFPFLAVSSANAAGVGTGVLRAESKVNDLMSHVRVSCYSATDISCGVLQRITNANVHPQVM
jgi:hypothetical protein